MKQKKNYVSPKVKIVSFRVEQGFAASNGKFIIDDNDPANMENASSNMNEQFNEDHSWFSGF